MLKETCNQFQYNIPHNVALQLERLATTFPKRRVDGSFSSRVMVTLFARKVPGFDETHYQPVIGATLMDNAYLDRLHWLERDGETNINAA